MHIKYYFLSLPQIIINLNNTMKPHVYSLILGFVFTLFCISLNAQDYHYIPLVKPGLQLWTCEHGHWGYNYYEFEKFALTDEDTVIENETYKKLYRFTDIEFDSTIAECIGGMRENTQRQVFFRGSLIEGEEINKMLYDFSLSVGDTFYYSDYSFQTFEVTNIDTVNYNGIERREFTIQTFGQIAAIWIEGIGDFEGLLISPRFAVFDNWRNTRCYIHNGDLLYSNFLYGANDCITPLLGINDVSLVNNSITIYPNPTNSDLNIKSETIINSIEIFNSLGHRVYQEYINSKEKLIDISSLSNGVYLIRFNTDNGYIKKKFIKN